MKNWFLLAFAGVMFMTPAKAASVIDIATLKCGDVEKMDQAAIIQLISWIDGYLGGRAEDTRFDSDRLAKNSDAADKVCQANPDEGIISVFKEIDAKNGQ